MATENQRPRPKTREGVVLKDRMTKTRIVAVTRLVRDPHFHKVVRRRVKYAVHDEKDESHAGDRVRIIESRPLSRTKRWKIVEILEKKSKAES